MALKIYFLLFLLRYCCGFVSSRHRVGSLLFTNSDSVQLKNLPRDIVFEPGNLQITRFLGNLNLSCYQINVLIVL